VAVAAVDGEQKLRRRSGEVRRSGKEMQWESSRVKARGNAWEAPGCAQGPEEGVVAREQELAVGGSHGGSSDGGATWRGRSRPARGREAAAQVLGRRGGGGYAAHGRRSGGIGREQKTEEERGWR
jgi:hypothetical protein